MALPAVQFGVPYKLNLGSSFESPASNGSSSGSVTYHSLSYVPASHASKGKVPPVIDAGQEASIAMTTRKGREDHSIELTFVATNGETNVVTGALLPSRNEFVLLFDGTSFNLNPLTSSALSMSESKKNIDRKRAASDTLEGGPESKKPKRTESTPPPVSTTNPDGPPSISSVSSASSHPTATSSVNFSLNNKTKKSAASSPTPSAASNSTPNSNLPSHSGSSNAQSSPMTPIPTSSAASADPAPKPLTKSTEMRMAKWDEPDSDDSDDSDCSSVEGRLGQQGRMGWLAPGLPSNAQHLRSLGSPIEPYQVLPRNRLVQGETYSKGNIPVEARVTASCEEEGESTGECVARNPQTDSNPPKRA